MDELAEPTEQQEVVARFTDRKKREWTIDLDYGLIQQVKTETSVNLLKLFERNENNLTALAGDHDKMLGVLWVLLEPQAAKQNIDVKEFWSGFDDDIFYAAFQAVLMGTIYFFRPEKRPALLRILERMDEMDQRALSLMKEKVEGAKLDQLIDQAIAEESDRIDQELNTALMKSSDESISSPAA